MAPASHLVIVNPQARHGETERLLPVIERLLANSEHELVATESPGHAVELAAAAAGRAVVVAAGGDGTVHEVLNGLMRIDSAQRPALALLPTGSGNDTCRTLGIPFALAQAAALLSTGERRRFDCGVCNGTFFNNSFATGLDARVTAKAVEYKVTKQRDGMWLYLTSLMHVLFNDLAPFEARVSFDGGDATAIRALIIAVTNGATYGGGFRINPQAVADDGLFDVCDIDPLGLGQALWRLPFVITGHHARMPVVHMSRHRSVTIDGDVPLPAQVDGEVFLERRYDVGILPAAIEYVVPRRPQ